MDWITYTATVSDGATLSTIARKIGISHSTVSRWSNTDPKPKDVVAFARAYGRPVLEAFVAAGFITESDAQARPASLSVLKSTELLEELRRRITPDGQIHSSPRPETVNTARKEPTPNDFDLAAGHIATPEDTWAE